MRNLLVQIPECLSVCAEFISANLVLIRTNKFCTFLFPYGIFTFKELIFGGIYTLKEENFTGIKFCGKPNEVNFARI